MRDETTHEWGTQIGNLWVGHPPLFEYDAASGDV